MAGRFTLEAVFKAVDAFTRPIRNFERSFGRLRNSVRSLDGLANKVSGSLKRIGAVASAAALAAGAALHNVVGVGAEFEQSLINAAAKFPDQVEKGTAAFMALETAAKQVGGTTEFTAAQSAQALDFLAMAGFSSAQAVGALPGVVDLATAGTLDLARATDIASDSLGAFGLMTTDATRLQQNLTRVNDVFAKTANSANTTIEMMFEAIKTGGPVAKSAGASIETFSAMVGELANSGIKGEAAGTALRNMFLRLSAPPGEAAKALGKLKVKTTDSMGNMRDVVAIMGDIGRAVEKLGTADKAGALSDIFGMRAVASANILLQSGEERLNAYRKTLEGAQGASAKMAATMRDSTSGDMKSFSSAFEAIKIQIFDVVKGPLREIVQGMTAWMRANKEVIATKVGEFIAMIRDNLPTIVKWAKRIGVALAALGAFVVIAKVVAAITTAVTVLLPVLKAIGVVLSPLVLIPFLVNAALIGLVVMAPRIWKALKAGAAAVVEAIGRLWSGAVDLFMSVWTPVASFFGSVWDTLQGIVVGVFEFWLGLIVLQIREWEFLWRPIVDFFAALWDAVVEYFRFQWDLMVAILSAAKDLLVAVWAPVSEFFSFLWEGIKTGAQVAWDWVAGIFTKVYDGITQKWEGLKTFFADLWSSVSSTFMEIVGPIFARIESAVDFIRGVGRGALGGDGAPAAGGAPGGPQVVSPQERVSREISESRHSSTSRGEVVILDQTGRAQVTRRPKGGGLTLEPSGAL